MTAQSFDPNLARKEWGWRKFGKKAGISVLLTRGRWMGFKPYLSRDRHTVTVRLNLGLGQLWMRIPYR